jgi:hypothetical protein
MSTPKGCKASKTEKLIENPLPGFVKEAADILEGILASYNS